MPDSPSITRWRSLWLSDVRLGGTDCQALALIDFLDRHHSDMLYLVGSTIDARSVKTEGGWPQTHNDVLERLLRKAREGCRVILIPGERDAFAAQFVGMTIGDIDIASDCIHVLANGKRVLVACGDRHDHGPSLGRWQAVFGDNLYRLRRLATRFQSAPNAPHPAAHGSRGRAHSATHPTWTPGKFEQEGHYAALQNRARALGLDGTICGALATPVLEMTDTSLLGVPGSWTLNATLLGENETGGLSVIKAPLSVANAVARPKVGIQMPTLPSALQRGHIRHHP